MNVYYKPVTEVRWECELLINGEKCYMGNESYNPEWSPDDS